MSKILVTPIDYMGTDLTVVNAARVSFNKKHETFQEKDEGLIKYLAKHKHISPFGHCFASFHVKAPIFIARQLVKHKFLRWNEVSRRYVDDAPEFYAPNGWRARAKNAKQGSGSVVSGMLNEQAKYELNEAVSWADKAYHNLLGIGMCPEQARMVLPQNMMTEWYWSGSLDAFADMCRLRLDPHTQYESQLVAQQVDACMSERFPISWGAMLDEDW